MTKQALRKAYLEKRFALSDEEYNSLSQAMCETFFSSIDLSGARVLHTFIPIEKNKEPNTWLIINRLQKDFPGISISIPKINNQTAMLDNFYLEDAEQLEKNTWGIPEPREGRPTPLEKIDIVLVPLLAVDSKGHRVGYGRGFYDKFLNQCPASVLRVGLSFFPPVESINDVNENDQSLTHVVTPTRVYEFLSNVKV
jgi:5-formyltetrahydrofolate cyclo-ligase